MRAYEVLMVALERPCSRRLFFILFEVSRRGEKLSNRNQWEHLSLKGNFSYKFFKLYSDSLKPWKHNYFWVILACLKAAKSMKTLDDEGGAKSIPFPTIWTPTLYNRRLRTYSVKEERLDEAAKKTLRLLRNLVSYLPYDPKGTIKVYPLMKASPKAELRAALGGIFLYYLLYLYCE